MPGDGACRQRAARNLGRARRGRSAPAAAANRGRVTNNGSASAWHKPICAKRCLGYPMAATATSHRKRGRPSLGPRHSVITSVPTEVRDALDAIAAAIETSRGVTISDLTALALGRPDLAHRLTSGSRLTPSEAITIAAQPLPANAGAWRQITTYVPVGLLPALDELVAETGVNRSRVLANLVTHMVERRGATARIDVAWPERSTQGRLPLAI